MKEIAIKDLYAGKPDAKDEIDFEGQEKFIKTFVVADHFNLESLLSGSNCFITGFKGTGKTALMFYLDGMLKERDHATCSSFVFFKEDFADARRKELQELSRRILSSIAVEPGALTEISEFEYIWRWLIFKQIVNDNEDYGRNLFVDNEIWRSFERIILKIKDPSSKRKISIPNKIKVAVPWKDPFTMSEVTPEMEVDLRKQGSEAYFEFMSLIDQAEEMFSQLTKTDIPYYIFIDELEAYYGNDKIFKRDLYMIRDLVFTVKRLNSIFARAGIKNMKILCSIRSEIITAISRFIVTKEINKVVSGFSLPLNWNYSNDNSYAHPIIQILLKRISVCAEADDESSLSIYRKWFPEKIHGIEPASYILNNSWCKPRDIVRLIITAQNNLHNSEKCFSNSVISALTKAYSEDSLQEIKEELRALYASEEIDIIISCFTGYKTNFSIRDLKNRIAQYYPETVLETKFQQVLDDLYRLGFIGNFLPASKTYHWLHKGDPNLILSDEWRICIHYALHSALSIGGKNDYGLNIGRDPQTGDTTKATVVKVIPQFALVEFKIYGNMYDGRIHIGEFANKEHRFICNLSELVKIGDTYDVVLSDFNEKHACWNLKFTTMR